MKKIISAVLVLVMVLCAASCFALSPVNEGNPPLAPEFFLKGNPTTGYEWKAVSSNEAVVTALVEYTPDEGKEGAVGVGGEYWIRLDGMSAGQAVVTLSYARSWESSPDDLVYEVSVEVDEDLNVLINSFAQVPAQK